MMRAYFIGIAGAGVSALASILKAEGYEVSGSDEGVFPPISTYLERAGIPYKSGFSKDNIPENIDIAIVGTTAKIDPETNEELREIIARNIPYYTFAEFLGFHTKTRENLIIAGSFGKSSLTALITHLLVNGGKDPGWFIGAIAKDLETTGNWGTEPQFIMEGDEYVVSLKDRRSKFELYSPKDILISSIVHDHVNMFPTFHEYQNRFLKLIEKLPSDGKLFCADKYESIKQIVKQACLESRAIWYGFEKCDGYYAQNIKIGEVTSFELVCRNGEIIALETIQLGYHNIENIVAACAYILEKGLLGDKQLKAGVRCFQGVERRLDKKTKVSKVPVYEGFGSSYEKARSAIEAIQLHFPNRKIICVFEPHTFSWRNRSSLHWYDTVFEGVDEVLLLPPPVHGAANHSQLSHDEILKRAKIANLGVEGVKDGDEVLAKLNCQLSGNEVILLLSSGPLYGLPSSLPKLLDQSA